MSEAAALASLVTGEACGEDDLGGYKIPRVGTFARNHAGMALGAYLGAIVEPRIATPAPRMADYPADAIFAVLLAYAIIAAGPRLVKEQVYREIFASFLVAYAGASTASYRQRQSAAAVARLNQLIEEAAAA